MRSLSKATVESMGVCEIDGALQRGIAQMVTRHGIITLGAGAAGLCSPRVMPRLWKLSPASSMQVVGVCPVRLLSRWCPIPQST